MSVRFRPIDRRRTCVIQVNSGKKGPMSRHIWFAIHRRERDWAAVFGNALGLLMETSDLHQQVIRFADGAGQITWQRTSFWTKIRLELNAFSNQKRVLIAAALLKAARYTD